MDLLNNPKFLLETSKQIFFVGDEFDENNILKLYKEIFIDIKQTPNISVLLATYNNEHTIGESIKSILEQTYENFELLILDDGSTDKTRNIVEEFNDARIRFFKTNKT